MGMPKIRTEIRYAKASPEFDVQNLQTLDNICAPNEKRPSKGKKKKGAKKAK